MKNKFVVITAAGGNGTAIRILDAPMSRAEYAEEGGKLGKKMEEFGAEQAGFLIPSVHHFEMGGGEFCGNAARSAAILFSEISGSPSISFTMSGYSGVVSGKVKKIGDNKYFVECEFPGLPTDLREISLTGGQTAKVVDLGGIVHVVIDAPFPSEPSAYQAAHREIMNELHLTERSAVGVIWIEHAGEEVKMHPVVWVRDVNTFFYEQSCGSGSIAVGKVTGISSVVQPTGERIEPEITPDAVILRSEMEVVREED